MKKVVALLLVVVLTLAMVAGCTKPTDKTLEKINIAYHTNMSGAGVVVAAKEKGLFEKYGFEPNLVGFTSGPIEVAAMSSGEIDYGYIGPGATTLAIQNKVNILTFEKLGDAEAIYTSTSKGIKTLADLKGKKVGTTLGTTGEQVLNEALRSVGLDPEKDVSIVNMDMGACVVAMVSEQIDAVCVFEQYRTSVEKGLGDKSVKLAKTSDFPAFSSPSSWLVTPSYLEKNREQVVRFTACILEAIDYLVKNKDEIVKLTVPFLGGDLDFETAMISVASSKYFTSEEYKKAIEDKSIDTFYTNQQKVFLKDGKIPALVPVSNYFRYDIVEEAFKLIESKK